MSGKIKMDTRVQKLDTDDYKKLARVMQYLCNTRELALMIKPSAHPRWWVDSSYTVHPDMRSHSGLHMTLVKGTHTQHPVHKN